MANKVDNIEKVPEQMPGLFINIMKALTKFTQFPMESSVQWIKLSFLLTTIFCFSGNFTYFTLLYVTLLIIYSFI